VVVQDGPDSEVLYAHFGSVEDAKLAAEQFAASIRMGWRAIDSISMESRYRDVGTGDAE